MSRKNKDDKNFNYNSEDIQKAIQVKVSDMYGDFGLAATKAGFTGIN